MIEAHIGKNWFSGKGMLRELSHSFVYIGGVLDWVTNILA